MNSSDSNTFQHGAMIFRQDTSLCYVSVYNPLFGLTAKGIIGRSDRDILPEEFAAELTRIKSGVLESGKSQNRRLNFKLGDSTLTVDVSVSPISIDSGEVIGLVGCIVDMTSVEQREQQLNELAAGLAEFTTRLNMALEGSSITIFEQDEELRYTFMHNPPHGTRADEFLGRSDYDLFEEDRHLEMFEAKLELLRTGEATDYELTAELAGEMRTFDVKLEPKKMADGRVIGLIGVSVDMSDRKNQEEHWRLVMREMTHRSKNLLAVIQAMARQTAARSESTDIFVRDFTRRLRAMSVSHDLLVNENWRGVDLKKLVEMHVSQVIDLESAQVTIHGNKVALDASSAQNLGLALHELMTNAVKYGSLSMPEGRLTVSWDADGDEICIYWIESNGPPVVASENSGFGRNLLETAIGASLDGSVELKFKPEGLVCEICIPPEHVVALG
jgi:PAS domain S-box-containing protein